MQPRPDAVARPPALALFGTVSVCVALCAAIAMTAWIALAPDHTPSTSASVSAPIPASAPIPVSAPARDAAPRPAGAPRGGDLDGGTPTLAHKIFLASRLREAPQVALIGSSRTLRLEPPLITRLTGRSAFNAAVSSGSPWEGLQAARYLDARFPDRFPHLVIGLEPDLFVRWGPPRRSLEAARQITREVPPSFIGSWARATPLGWGGRRVVTDLGVLARDPNDVRLEAGVTMEHRVRADVRRLTGTGPGSISGFRQLSPRQMSALGSLIGLANRRGDTPVVFLTPTQPDAWARLAGTPLPDRHRELRAHLLAMQEQGRLRLVDLSSVASFGGDPTAFYDRQHMTFRNARRVVAHLARVGAFEVR